MIERSHEVYLDYMASTPCDPLVVEAMMPFLLNEFANPSSSHRMGARVARAVEESRERVAKGLGCLSEEVFFTSGATESNNLALLGCQGERGGKRTKIVTTPIEHRSVLGTCEWLAKNGFEIALCPVRADGQIDLGRFSELVDTRTLLVSIQAANNEIGTLQPLNEVAQLAHRSGATVHCDAAQALGKISFNVHELDLDVVSFSAHKCYGPKGIGALFVRGGRHTGTISPIFKGGGQESEMRPGTENVPGIVGFGKAVSVAMNRMDEDTRRVSGMRDRLESIVGDRCPGVVINGAVGRRLPGATSLTFAGVDADAIIANAPELALSSTSACHSRTPQPSHVLRAIGLSQEVAYSTLRVGIGRFTLPTEIEYAGQRIVEIVGALRDLSQGLGACSGRT